MREAYFSVLVTFLCSDKRLTNLCKCKIEWFYLEFHEKKCAQSHSYFDLERKAQIQIEIAENQGNSKPHYKLSFFNSHMTYISQWQR